MKKRYLTIMMATMVASTLLFGCGNASSSADNSDYFGNASDEAVADDANGDAASEETEEAQDARKTVEYNSCFDSLLANALIIDAEYLTLTSDDQVIATYGEPDTTAEGNMSNHQFAYYCMPDREYPEGEGLLLGLQIRDGGLNYYHISALNDDYNYLIDYMKEEGKWNMPIECIETYWDISGERSATNDAYFDELKAQCEAGKITDEERKDLYSQFVTNNNPYSTYEKCVEAFGNEGLLYSISDGCFEVAWYVPDNDLGTKYGDEITTLNFDISTGESGRREGWGRR